MITIFIYLFSFSIFLAAITGLIKFKTIEPSFYPFIICIWVGAVNELISIVISELGFTTAFNNNIYILIESFLLVWLFYKWGLFAQRKKIYYSLIFILILTWCVSNSFLKKLGEIDLLFRVSYSFLIVLMSILMINALIYDDKKSLLKNPIFLICIGFVLFYTYKILFEIFWIYGLNFSRKFRVYIFELLAIVNLIVNILFCFAILCIPRSRHI